jgi:hypothetical protein
MWAAAKIAENWSAILLLALPLDLGTEVMDCLACVHVQDLSLRHRVHDDYHIDLVSNSVGIHKVFDLRSQLKPRKLSRYANTHAVMVFPSCSCTLTSRDCQFLKFLFVTLSLAKTNRVSA